MSKKGRRAEGYDRYVPPHKKREHDQWRSDAAPTPTPGRPVRSPVESPRAARDKYFAQPRPKASYLGSSHPRRLSGRPNYDRFVPEPKAPNTPTSAPPSRVLPTAESSVEKNSSSTLSHTPPTEEAKKTDPDPTHENPTVTPITPTDIPSTSAISNSTQNPSTSTTTTRRALQTVDLRIAQRTWAYTFKELHPTVDKQMHETNLGRLVDPDAISQFEKPAQRLIGDEKKKLVSYPEGIPRARMDPRLDPKRKHKLIQDPKARRCPQEFYRLPSLSYNENSLRKPESEIVIQGLGDIWNESYLRNQLEEFGKVDEHEKIMDPNTGMSLGILRVKFVSDNVDEAHRNAVRAARALHGTMFDGKQISVFLSKNDVLRRITRDEINARRPKPAIPASEQRPLPGARHHVPPPTSGPHATVEEQATFPPHSVSTNGSLQPVERRAPFVPPEEKAMTRPHIFINMAPIGKKVRTEDFEVAYKDYKYSEILMSQAGCFILFDTMEDAKRCFGECNTQKVRGARVLMKLVEQKKEQAEEKPEPVPEPEVKDPITEVTATLTRDFQKHLLKDITETVIRQSVIKYLNPERYPHLKEKLEAAKPVPLPVLKPKTATTSPISVPEGVKVKTVEEDVYSPRRPMVHQLPSFKKKGTAAVKKEKKELKELKKKKTDTMPLGRMLNFENEVEEENDSSLSTPQPVLPDEDNDGPPKKKPKIMKPVSMPVLYSSSEDEDEAEEESKESNPTTPETQDLEQKTVVKLEENEESDEDEPAEEEQSEDEDVIMEDAIVDYSGWDKYHRPTASDLPKKVFDDKEDRVFDLAGLKEFIRDEEDFALLKELAALEPDVNPIEYDVEYWAWKQADLAAVNSKRTAELELPANLESSTGSSRSEGYVKIADEMKVEYLPHRRRVHDPLTTIQDHDEGESSKTSSSRVNRANNRRLVYEVSNFQSESNEMTTLNQLNTRKKPVSFARSAIHNWGLYALEPIAEREMIIEYVGERIRQQVAEVRERAYLKSGIGSSYLFRVDENTVIDATKKGGIARFINHCCVPSCTAKIIMVGGQKHIVIYALRDIAANEELTYDYKFEREENDNERVRCLCGAPGCKGYLN